MEALAILGCVGLGAVWGWLAGLLLRPGAGRVRHLWRSLLGLGGSTALLAGLVVWLADWRFLLVFAAAALFALLLHLAWLRELRGRVVE